MFLQLSRLSNISFYTYSQILYYLCIYYGLLQLWRNYYKIPLSIHKKEWSLWFYQWVLTIPFVKRNVQKEINSFRNTMKVDLNQTYSKLSHFTKLPLQSLSTNSIHNLLKTYQTLYSYDNTKISGTIYELNPSCPIFFRKYLMF